MIQFDPMCHMTSDANKIILKISLIFSTTTFMKTNKVCQQFIILSIYMDICGKVVRCSASKTWRKLRKKQNNKHYFTSLCELTSWLCLKSPRGAPTDSHKGENNEEESWSDIKKRRCYSERWFIRWKAIKILKLTWHQCYNLWCEHEHSNRVGL